MGIIKIVLLVSLLKLQGTVKPMTLAILYTSLSFLVGIMSYPFSDVLLGSIIGFLLAWGYFWLLHRLEGSGLWWVVMICGLFIGLV